MLYGVVMGLWVSNRFRGFSNGFRGLRVLGFINI